MTPDHEAAIRRACDALADALLAAVSEQPEPGPEKLLSVAETCATLGLSRSAVYALFSAGGLRSISAGRRRLVPASAIRELVDP